jgi:hypothetical protein
MNLCFFTGGGVALLYASNELSKLPTANFDQKIGVQIIQNALKVSIFCTFTYFSFRPPIGILFLSALNSTDCYF